MQINARDPMLSHVPVDCACGVGFVVSVEGARYINRETGYTELKLKITETNLRPYGIPEEGS